MIGDMLVSEIRMSDIQQVLEPIWIDMTETTSRLRGRIESVLAWATVAGHRESDNPARWKGNRDAILRKPTKVAKAQNHPAIAVEHAADWYADLR